MKKVLKLTAVLAFMLVTSKGLANEPKLNVLSNTNAKSLVFELDASSKETSVKFFDLDGNIMYSEAISGKSAYTKKFDLKDLKEGSYYLKVDNALREIVYTLEVDATDVKIVDKKENAKPVFRAVDGMVFLNLLNLKAANVEIKIYDSSNRMLFEEVVRDELKIEKAFNFKDAFKDSYTLMVKDSNGVYYKDFVVN
ncbi:hypothetical protein [uncultured Kriegella sp.]|uniref:hypothetical protein n=1 Tax=uncultured Kriegella sp. TaxID=1798910 RepID=UPI0030DDA73B